MASMFESVLNACFNEQHNKTSKKIVESKSNLFEDEVNDDIKIDKADLADDKAVEDMADDDTSILFDTDSETDDEDATSDEDEELLVTVVSPGDISDKEAAELDVDDFLDCFVLHCKACGKVVLSKEALGDGEPCPECGQVNVDDDNQESCLEVVGKIAPNVDETEETENTEDAEDTNTDDSDIIDETETEAETEDGVETETNSEDENEDETTAEESYKRIRKNITKERKIMNREIDRNRVRRTDNSRVESRNTTGRSIMLDESTFNPFLKRFVTENYNNATNFYIVDAKKSGNKLTLECKLSFRSGNSKRVRLVSENFVPTTGEFKFSATEREAFQIESTQKRKPFVFTASMRNGIIRCEGLKYNYETTLENKTYNVYGSLIKESRRRG